MKYFGWRPSVNVSYFSQKNSVNHIQKYSVINGITSKKNKCAHIYAAVVASFSYFVSEEWYSAVGERPGART
jgi:hypothetical protein